MENQASELKFNQVEQQFELDLNRLMNKYGGKISVQFAYSLLHFYANQTMQSWLKNSADMDK